MLGGKPSLLSFMSWDPWPSSQNSQLTGKENLMSYHVEPTPLLHTCWVLHSLGASAPHHLDQEFMVGAGTAGEGPVEGAGVVGGTQALLVMNLRRDAGSLILPSHCQLLLPILQRPHKKLWDKYFQHTQASSNSQCAGTRQFPR